MFGTGLVTNMFCLLVAWAGVPGFHIRRISGLVVASILIVGFHYAVIVMTTAIQIRN
jgi:hypothetical protein